MIHLNRSEALRYAGVPDAAAAEATAEAAALASMAEKLERIAPPRWVYRVCPVEAAREGLSLAGSGLILPGETAKNMLSGCARAVLLCCTLGAAFETFLRAEQARGMDRALLADACGSALVEAGCDGAEAEIRGRYPGLFLTDRFSPGYGDLPLSLQPQMLTALHAGTRLGVTVTGSLLMNPAKSVTAVIGLAAEPKPARIRGCAFCALRERCVLRKGGKSCVSGTSEE